MSKTGVYVHATIAWIGEQVQRIEHFQSESCKSEEVVAIEVVG